MFIGKLVFVIPLAVSAATFTVNTTDDLSDTDPGDGVCVTSDGTCSLRAAIQESNALSGNDGNVVSGSYVGVDISGATGLGNDKNGIEIDSANNLIGGTTPAARNVISGNLSKGGGGILLSGGAASGNVIQGNFIGTNAA